MERFRLEVGAEHGVKPGNIVGAIANEAGLDGQHIGHIEINADFSLIDLPVGMPREVLRDLKKVWVCGQTLRITRLDKPLAQKEPKPKPKKSAGKKRKPKSSPKKKRGKPKAKKVT
jgi:ATP-dependent RNA helicase DeaD